MTVYTAITARVAPGKLNEASAHLAKYAEAIKNLTGHEIQILGEVGEINSVRTVATYESLADMEKTIDACWSDEGYRKLVDSAAGLFTDGETKVWKATG